MRSTKVKVTVFLRHLLLSLVRKKCIFFGAMEHLHGIFMGNEKIKSESWTRIYLPSG